MKQDLTKVVIELCDFLSKARKIVGLEPISDADIKDHFSDTMDEYNAMKNMVRDFLTYEIKTQLSMTHFQTSSFFG